jgi:hypothetical protein
VFATCNSLYTIVAGLALSDGITVLVGTGEPGWRDPLAVELLAAFVVTLVPFFHGALRHFDDTYLVSDGAKELGRATLAVDFGFLFAQSVVLFALAHQLNRVESFSACFALLLLIDIIWVVAISSASPAGRDLGQELWTMVRHPRASVLAQQRWARNNLRHLIMLGVVIAGVRFFWSEQDVLFGFLVLLVAVSRTFWDYRGSWEFYFPADPRDAEASSILLEE